MAKKNILNTNPYKGTRDFYPDNTVSGTYDLRSRNFIFETWREVLKKHGYVEYDVSLLENAEMYIAKSGEELGREQLYTFTDKGDRKLALRPEMTPSLSRIVAAKHRELKFPLRWFSIPNCFRYERPQKGRLREHWQLNVDVIGLEAGAIELEILDLVASTFKTFGANKNHFKILYNHRGILDEWIRISNFQGDQDIIKKVVYKTLDNWYKQNQESKLGYLMEYINESDSIRVLDLGNKVGEAWDLYLKITADYPEITFLNEILTRIHPDIEFEFSPTIIRGIAYYTGLVFEAFDKNPENPRSLFGGGRYDNLLDLFGKHEPAIGFGWGDVTMHEFLKGHELMPDFNTNQKTGIIITSYKKLPELFSQMLPQFRAEGKLYDINYEYERSLNKRKQSLNRRGCQEIIIL